MNQTVLSGSRCRTCGLVAVPPEPFGCERCGAVPAQFDAATVESVGTVTAAAVVHRHGRPEPATPFVVAEVHLDAGPVLKAIVRGAEPSEVTIGTRMHGVMLDGGFAFVPTARSESGS